ncbi:hypothetical protein AAG906_017074 [Vitis piasezkii]
MEEQQERRNVGEIELEGGQPIRNSGQTGPELREHRMDIVEISPRVKNWIGSFKKQKKGTQNIKKIYEPRVISVGHRSFVHKIGRNIKAVKKCYDWSSTKKDDDEELAWMMLLDGCFLLQFIRWKGMRNFRRNHQINFVVQDLFLLENQLPFGVLKLIFEGTNFQGGLPMEKNIKIFITYFGMPEGLSSEIQLEEVNEAPSHLLDLCESSNLRKRKVVVVSRRKVGFCCRGKRQTTGHLAVFLHIKELKAAGIYLKPSRTCFLRDISFKSYFFFGYLKLPPITIDDFTKTKFLNMVAYEMCRDATDDNAVTSYICFLDELIDHADDVKELRSKHILHNLLGSDDDVAKIFNEISNDLVDPEAYKDVKDCIQKHYDKRVNTWTAQALHNHFRSPWTAQALHNHFSSSSFDTISYWVQTYYALPEK